MKQTDLKQLIKEAILEALVEFTSGGVALANDELKEDEGIGEDIKLPGDTIPDIGGNDTIQPPPPPPPPLPPGPFTGGLGI